MICAVRLRHEDLDIAPNHLLGGVAEKALSRRAERLDQAGLADHHHGVRHRFQDRPEMSLARHQVGRVPLALLDRRAPALAHQRADRPDRRQHAATEQAHRQQLAGLDRQDDVHGYGHGHGQRARRSAAIDAGDDHGRHKERIDRRAAEADPERLGDRGRDGHQRDGGGRPDRDAAYPPVDVEEGAQSHS